MTSTEVRSKLVEALEIDLVGPRPGLGNPTEKSEQAPSRWYLTGFLIPLKAGEKQAEDPDANEEVGGGAEGGGPDDEVEPEHTQARTHRLPSSIGMSVLVPAQAVSLAVTVRWGDYTGSDLGTSHETWARQPFEKTITLPVNQTKGRLQVIKVPSSDGVEVAYLVRRVGIDRPEVGLPADVWAISLFLVNRRVPVSDEKRDEAYLFQAELDVACDAGFLAKPDLRSLDSKEWDECVADVQYRDAGAYSTGHNVATESLWPEGEQGTAPCRRVVTRWIPQAEVERVAVPPPTPGVALSMDALAGLQDAAEAQAKLKPMVDAYRSWINGQKGTLGGLLLKRRQTGELLMQAAEHAANRIEAGIQLLQQPDCLKAFRLANRAMAHAARRRQGVMLGKDPASTNPKWRDFQLAFILMNLRGLAEPASDDREVVDLLFFPTGGGKTEAYLGLAAFTLLLRRLRNQDGSDIGGAGLSILMRYTLRLLTLDQLGRASTLICALELIRREDVEMLGRWPFEIGLWVGQGATPNVMGSKDEDGEYTARRKTRDYKNDSSKPRPIPIETCPWCGQEFTPNSFSLYPNPDYPTELRVRCLNPKCEFSKDGWLPVHAIDETIYRRLPCFLIATADKFAALPWTGRTGAFFGHVNRYDKEGFYGPCDGTAQGTKWLPNKGNGQTGLLPPDLIIQDELHLISGPLGTMAGLYESAIEDLCIRERDGKKIRPKVVASTATVRRAEQQIRALFNRGAVEVFPPPGPDRRDSFFARTLTAKESPARLYLGVTAQGKSQKVALIRVYLALLAAAQKWFEIEGKNKPDNAADPYMTLLGYFNSLRELGGTRRLVEDEIRTRLEGYGKRKRIGDTNPPFVKRTIAYDPVELTSRESTANVSANKKRLEKPFTDKDHVDVALATNMISVGLDITRLGLMVVFGQPKTTAEYIQSTSRVGRDEAKPGLVVTLLSVHKPRDRSHYERFVAYHQSFYRSVEATSVTPFSPRALDRGLAAVVVALSRHGIEAMTPPKGAELVVPQRSALDSVVDVLGDRARDHRKDVDPPGEKDKLRQRVRDRTSKLLDQWVKVVDKQKEVGARLQYNPTEAGGAVQLLRDFLHKELQGLPPTHWKMRFRANRSLRDVEASSNVWAQSPDGVEIGEDV